MISTKKTLHLTNIRNLKKKILYTCQTSAISKITPHLTNIRDLKLFHVKNSHVKTGKKYVSHFSKGVPETPFPMHTITFTFTRADSSRSKGRVNSGHSRTGHTGHTARLASKLARLANRLPGTNVPGWNFGWPTPKSPVARPTLLIFLLISPRLIFPRFSLAY